VEGSHGFRPRADRQGWVLVIVLNINPKSLDGFAIVVDELVILVNEEGGKVGRVGDGSGGGRADGGIA
jgi:hypothetical protein